MKPRWKDGSWIEHSQHCQHLVHSQHSQLIRSTLSTTVHPKNEILQVRIDLFWVCHPDIIFLVLDRFLVFYNKIYISCGHCTNLFCVDLTEFCCCWSDLFSFDSISNVSLSIGLTILPIQLFSHCCYRISELCGRVVEQISCIFPESLTCIFCWADFLRFSFCLQLSLRPPWTPLMRRRYIYTPSNSTLSVKLAEKFINDALL